jgi:hypothetical protein
VTDASEWHTAASFAVVFAQRQFGDATERRVEVERTEVEPPQDPQAWPGWDCEPVCGWMLSQLGRSDSGQQESGAGTGGAQAHPAEEPAGQAAPLFIDSAVIIGATGQADLVQAGALAANPPAELVAPVRVVLSVSGAQPGTKVQAVTRILWPDAPGWNPQDPVYVPVNDLGASDPGGTAIPEGWQRDAGSGRLKRADPGSQGAAAK